MTSNDPCAGDFDYDELAYLGDNVAEAGLDLDVLPVLTRVEHELDDGRVVGALRWGAAEPRVVALHGSAQNAHTWDTTMLALGEPALCIDLPGHGASDWRADRRYDPVALAADVAVVVAALAPRAEVVVGMSLGGLTATVMAERRPELVRRLVVIDITPGVTRDKAKAIHDFVAGPQSFPDFAAILARTIEHNPSRTESSLRRGIVHNARRLPDGTWRWRYDRGEAAEAAEVERPSPAELWDVIERVPAPLRLVRGSESPVVDDDDIAELVRRRPGAWVDVVDGAGHSVQGDRPVELAEILRTELLRVGLDATA